MIHGDPGSMRDSCEMVHSSEVFNDNLHSIKGYADTVQRLHTELKEQLFSVQQLHKEILSRSPRAEKWTRYRNMVGKSFKSVELFQRLSSTVLEQFDILITQQDEQTLVLSVKDLDQLEESVQEQLDLLGKHQSSMDQMRIANDDFLFRVNSPSLALILVLLLIKFQVPFFNRILP